MVENANVLARYATICQQVALSFSTDADLLYTLHCTVVLE